MNDQKPSYATVPLEMVQYSSRKEVVKREMEYSIVVNRFYCPQHRNIGEGLYQFINTLYASFETPATGLIAVACPKLLQF